MINWSGPQSRSPRVSWVLFTLERRNAAFLRLQEDDGRSANRLSALRHYELPSVHFPARHNDPSPTPPAHDVMAHDIISFGMANLPFSIFFPLFLATLWTFINSDRITSGKGCTGTGLGHTQWVGKWQTEGLLGGGGGGEILLFQSRLNITIIKLQR